MSEAATFLGIPLELRCEIYRYLLVGVHEARTSLEKTTGHGSSSKVTRWSGTREIEESRDIMIKRDHEERKAIHSAATPETAVLRVSQQTYQEASAIFYTESKFWVSYEIGILGREGFVGVEDLVQKLHRACHLGIDIHQDSGMRHDEEPTIRLVSEILAYYSRGTASLRSLELSLDLGFFQNTRFPPILMVDRILQEETIQKLVSNFKVKEKLEIRTGVKTSPQFQQWSYYIAQAMDWWPHVARAKEWCWRVAQDKNWDLHQHRESNVNLDASLWQSWVLKPKHDVI